MHAVVRDEMGSEEIVGVPEMDEGVILDSGLGEQYPCCKPRAQDRNCPAIRLVDQSDPLSQFAEAMALRDTCPLPYLRATAALRWP